MNGILTDFLRFLNRSPTSWHACREVTNALAEAEFSPLQEDERWNLEPGKGYFVVRDDAALCAFRMPRSNLERAVILASHLDSPAIKLKPIPDLSQHNLAQFSTEIYGSPLLHTWLDRDLAIAGRAAVQLASGEVEAKLVFLDDYPMSIPSLPLHLDRSVSEKGLLINRQDHLKPIASIARSKHHPIGIEPLLRKHLSFETLLAFDLFLVPLEKPAFLGSDGELIAGYRLDNLSSAFASLSAILKASPSPSSLQLAVFWDHEEIGSQSYVGAESFFVNQIVERICLHRKIDREDYYRIKSRSYCASVDLAHGYNPNFSDRFDPRNTPYLGDGVVLKSNAMQKYATGASTGALIEQICRKHGWLLQKFASRADISSGSTVGSIMAAVGGFPTVDIGIAGWAMHSTRETIAGHDLLALCDLLAALLSHFDAQG